MLKYDIIIDPETGKEIIETELRGKSLLTTSLLNKGTAFTYEERGALGLLGKLPAGVESLEDQEIRVLNQYNKYRTDMQRNVFLSNLHDKNEILFYRLVSNHLSDMMPMIYTPVVGAAVKQFSHEFRQPRGMYISYNDQDRIEEILNNRTHLDIQVIVATDGEGVLGIGDQGVGAMDIPVAKLMVYTLCGGINPYHAMPVMLDAGTDNESLLEDPLYLGWRHKRIRGEAYDQFIDKFVNAVKKVLPGAFLHWEDLGRDNARRILEHYEDKTCTFNDDMQGTAVVTLSAILSAVVRSGKKLCEQKVVIFGAGTAGVGIADQIKDAMVHEGLSEEEALKNFWLFDRPGLLIDDMDSLLSFQKPYARQPSEIEQMGLSRSDKGVSLEDSIGAIQPTILIGCSAVAGAFNENIIRTMAEFVERPIVLPLSNPTERCEATPIDILSWTDGKALVATGSPFGTISYKDINIEIAQSNNALAFPGIGLGVVACKATKLTKEMLWQACLALSRFPTSSDNTPYAPLLPNLNSARDVAKSIAIAVVNQAREEGVSGIDDSKTSEQIVEENMWEAYYRPIRPKS